MSLLLGVKVIRELYVPRDLAPAVLSSPLCSFLTSFDEERKHLTKCQVVRENCLYSANYILNKH